MAVSCEGGFRALDALRMSMSKGKVTVILCDLISRRLILVEVMFSIESTDRLDVTIKGDRGTEGG